MINFLIRLDLLRKTATVEEAIEIATKYQRDNWYPTSGKISYQLNFADAHGDAVVISVDKYGELAFTRKSKGENYLISTNFNRANSDNALEYPCQRYTLTEQMLSSIQSEDELTVDYFKSILHAVHQEGLFTRTLYSNIFDLKNGIIYLYHRHQSDEVVILNVDEELAKGNYIVRIKDLFSKKTTGKASRELIPLILLYCLLIIVGIGSVIISLRYVLKRRVLSPKN